MTSAAWMEQRRHFVAVRAAGHRAVHGLPDLLPNGAAPTTISELRPGAASSPLSTYRPAAATPDTVP